jgi:hypothetical protein
VLTIGSVVDEPVTGRPGVAEVDGLGECDASVDREGDGEGAAEVGGVVGVEHGPLRGTGSLFTCRTPLFSGQLSAQRVSNSSVALVASPGAVDVNVTVFFGWVPRPSIDVGICAEASGGVSFDSLIVTLA